MASYYPSGNAPERLEGAFLGRQLPTERSLPRDSPVTKAGAHAAQLLFVTAAGLAPDAAIPRKLTSPGGVRGGSRQLSITHNFRPG